MKSSSENIEAQLCRSAGDAASAPKGAVSAGFVRARRGWSTGLRASTAAVLIAGCAGVAQAQSAPVLVADVSAEGGAGADQPDDPQSALSRRGAERVYVHGRRVGSSMATMPDPQQAPQVVNVISGETMAEQGVTSLEQALRNVPGITTQIGEGGVMSGDQFFIRGLSAKNDIFTDGLRDFGVYTRDSFNYEQVEVLKGPSASAFGRGAAGGGINTSSKTPFLERAGAITGAIGDAEYGRLTADWNQPLGDGVAVRAAAMWHQSENTGRDHVYTDRWGIAPSIGFGLDSDTTITVAYFHQDEERVPDYGIPTVTPTGQTVARPVSEFGVDPKTFYGFAADIDETVVDTVTARLRHVINDNLTLTSDTKYGYYQRYSQFTPVSCNAACATALFDGDAATIPLGSVGGPGPYEQDTNGVQNVTTLSVSYPIGGLRNELLIGSDVSWQQNDRNQFNYATRTTTKNLLDPARTPNPTLAAAFNNIRDTTAKDVSVFFTDRMWFNEQWSVTFGARQAWYEVDQESTATAAANCGPPPQLPPGATCVTGSKTDFLTPQIGVIWEPSATQLFYVSYSSSAKPPGVSVGNGDTVSAGAGGVGTQDLEPEENTNIEAGMRLGLFGDRLQLQGAIFQTKKDNAKEEDESGAIVRSGDSQEITGLEIGLGGAITDQWSINANYTYLDTETTDCNPPAPTQTNPNPVCENLGNPIAFTPEHAASLWTTYNFTGALQGLEIGGGVTYQDDVFLNVANSAIAPGYTTLDGLISYAWDRYSISLNAYNLTDELYYAQVHGSRVTPGQGRTFVMTLGLVY